MNKYEKEYQELSELAKIGHDVAVGNQLSAMLKLKMNRQTGRFHEVIGKPTIPGLGEMVIKLVEEEHQRTHETLHALEAEQAKAQFELHDIHTTYYPESQSFYIAINGDNEVNLSKFEVSDWAKRWRINQEEEKPEEIKHEEVPTLEHIQKAMKWLGSNGIECTQLTNKHSRPCICIKTFSEFEIQISNDEVLLRAELWDESANQYKQAEA